MPATTARWSDHRISSQESLIPDACVVEVVTKKPTRTDLPILFLYNLDPEWDPPFAQEVVDEAEALMANLGALGHGVTPAPVSTDDIGATLRPHDPHAHIVFNWCEELPHVPRSDARVAGMLEDLGFAYTGATAAVLAASWNKPRVKRTLEVCGLPTPRGRVYTSPEIDDWESFPAIVKPAWEHCSVGLSREAVVRDAEELRAQVAQVLQDHAQPVLVEDFIDGREFRVCLFGNGSLEVLPMAEMGFAAFEDVRDRLCVYDSKFDPDSRHYHEIRLFLPAMIDEDDRRCMAEAAVTAYRAVGCRDYGRLDFRLRQGVFYILDVNPNPDLTSTGSFVCGAEEVGYTQAQLVSHLVNLAAERHPHFAQHGS
jgi:D-alanine-D-alanine ligase